MAVTKVNVEAFISLSKIYPVIDVRSEGEYQQAHFPGAYALPLFNNEERKVVGTAYKQQSREAAIKIGLDFFGKKMRPMVEEVEKLTAESDKKFADKRSIGNTNYNSKTILIHCWRGGMRSGAVAWLLDLYGFKVFTLTGGYKAFRNWVLHQFEKDYNFSILGGYTGSGKTPVLNELINGGEKIIDLEHLASHKGSAFGNIAFKPQPSQEMFENLLAFQLGSLDDECRSSYDREEELINGRSTLDFEKETSYNDDPSSMSDEESQQLQITNSKLKTPNSQNASGTRQPSTAVWLEDESQRIGLVNIPNALWKTMRKKPVYFLDIPFEERLQYLVQEYGKGDKEKLVNAILRIQKRLGGLETKTALNFLVENDVKECFRILLTYYDKHYLKALNNRETQPLLLTRIGCCKVDAKENSKRLLQLVNNIR